MDSKQLEAVGRLAGGVAHDFNNLLTVILGHVELMLERLPTAPDAETLRGIVLAVNRASDITAQLLAFGRQQPRRPEVLDAHEAVLDIMRVLGPLLGDHVTVSVTSDPEAKKVEVDRTQFGQIMLNLVLNAKDAMPEGGRLEVYTRLASSADFAEAGIADTGEPYVAISITDSGVGMDPGTAAQVFEPFFTTKEMGGGSGLGLASAYGLVRHNSGHVFVTTRIGDGTTFTLLFPRVESPLVPQVVATPSSAAGAAVLVVEDNEPIRRLATKVLRTAGYRVEEARDGLDALEKVKAGFEPELLVTDVMMPRLGGAELARRLRKQSPELSILYVSGHPFEALDLPTIDGVRTRYLAKPFTPSQLRVAAAGFFMTDPSPTTTPTL